MSMMTCSLCHGCHLVAWQGAKRISVCALMHVLKPNPEAGGCLGNVLHLYCLIGLHATTWVIVCSLICNWNLAYNEGSRIDCWDMIFAASEPSMTIIITLGRLYFMLFCWLPPINAACVWSGHTFIIRASGVRTPVTWRPGTCPWNLVCGLPLPSL
jgi:hypothetical protein